MTLLIGFAILVFVGLPALFLFAACVRGSYADDLEEAILSNRKSQSRQPVGVQLASDQQVVIPEMSKPS